MLTGGHGRTEKKHFRSFETNIYSVIKNIRNLRRLLHLTTKHRFLHHLYICQLAISRPSIDEKQNKLKLKETSRNCR